MRRRFLFLLAVKIVSLSVLLGCGKPLISEQPKPPTLNVSDHKLVFDPANCKVGSFGGVSDGCVHGRLEITELRKGVCEFQYKIGGCGGGSTTYRCEVPVDAGLVTVQNINGSVTTSFDLNEMTMIRAIGPGPNVTVLVENTGEYLRYLPNERRSEMTPRQGDRVKFRVRIYDDKNFTPSLRTQYVEPRVEFVVGDDKAWPWLVVAMEEMTVGDQRQVQVPLSIAAGVKQWIPTTNEAKMLYLEIGLISLEHPN